MKISFVIPCYNSSKTIENVVDEIKNLMLQRTDFEYEVILVNDYSSDSTNEVLKKIARTNKNIKAISLAKNFGQPNAILAGFQFVDGDYVITSDDDGQTPIYMIFDFIKKLETDNFDIVCAKYNERAQPSGFRKIGTWLNQKMSDWLIEKPNGIYMSSFFCARLFVIKEIIKYNQAYPYLSGLILRVTQNIGNVEVPQLERKAGKSNYTFKKLLKLWLNGFTAFSIKPLRITMIVGGIFFILGCLIFISKMFNVLFHINSQFNNSMIISVLLFIGGVTLFFLGLIGEYIGRIYMCINSSPQFVIREITQSKNIIREEDNNGKYK